MWPAPPARGVKEENMTARNSNGGASQTPAKTSDQGGDPSALLPSSSVATLLESVENNRNTNNQMLQQAVEASDKRFAAIESEREAAQAERDRINALLSANGMQVTSNGSSAPAQTSTGGTSRNLGGKWAEGLSLVKTIAHIIASSGGPMATMDVVAAVKTSGYKTKSDDLRPLVSQALSKTDKVFKNVGRGIYDVKGNRDSHLHRADGAQPAQTAAPARAKASTAKGGKAKKTGGGKKKGGTLNKTQAILAVMTEMRAKDVSADDIYNKIIAKHPEITRGDMNAALSALRNTKPEPKIKATGEARKYKYSLVH